jgi:hypothetical protein
MRTWLLGVSAIVASLAASAVRADLLLAAFSGDAIYRFDGSTATLFASSSAMDGPTAMVYDAAGDLLVLNEFSHNVLKFNGTTGAFIGTLIDSAALAMADPGFDPGDMEMGADGHLYIMSHFNGPFSDPHGVHKFNATTGAYLGVFTAPRPVRHQHGMSFGPGGDLFQGNVDMESVERFDGTTGAFEGTFAMDADLFPIADLTFSPTSMYVALHTGGLARFDGASGAFLGYIEPTSGPGYWGLAVDGGTLYASNLAAGSIHRYDALTGAFLGATVVGGGAFDILPMPSAIPEASGAAMALLVTALAAACHGMRRVRGTATP